MLQPLHKTIMNVASVHGHDSAVVESFLARLEEGAYTRDENPHTHFCVFFAAYDPEQKQVFIGHHIKSGLWLFNGGHIDRGETPSEAVQREIGEEWGLELSPHVVGEPRLLTITEIDNPHKQTCTRHYDIWHFIPFDKSRTTFDVHKLALEYYQIGWLTLDAAREIVTDPANLQALKFVNTLFNHA